MLNACFEAFSFRKCKRNVPVCNSGTTLWLGGTTLVVDFYHLLVWCELLAEGREGLYVLNVIFSFSSSKLDMVEEDQKLLSVDDELYRKGH